MKARTIFWIAVIALFLLLTGSGLWYLQSDSFQESIRASLTSRIEAETGLECRIERIKLDLYRGILHVDNVRLEAQDAESGFVVLTMDEMHARFSISSLWHFRMRLGELRLVRPKIKLLTGGDDDGTGWNPNDFLDSLRISLRLETETLTVQDGEFAINEFSAPFNLSLDGLECRISYDDALPSYRIFLAYRESRLFYENRDIIHALKLTADLSVHGLKIETLEFRHDETLLSGSGSVDDWDAPALLLDMAGVVDAGDLVLADSSLYEGRGEIDVNTRVRYDRDGIYLKGDFSSEEGAYRKMQYREMAGSFEILHDVLYLTDVTGKVAQGNFVTEGEIQLRSSNNKPNRLTVEAERMPLVEVGNLLNIPEIGYRNRADFKTLLTWGFGRRMTLDCEADLHGAGRESADGLKSTPLGGEVQFSYDADGDITLSSVNLISNHTSVRAFGGKNEPFHIRLSTSVLSDPLDLITNFYPPITSLIESYPDLPAMEGNFEFNGDVWIHSFSEIEIDGGISITNGKWRFLEMDIFKTDAHLKGSRLKFDEMLLRRDLQTVQGELSLDFGDKAEISGIEFIGDVRNIQLDSLKEAGLFDQDLKGVLSGSGSIRYEQSAWNGSSRLYVESGSLEGEPFDHFIGDMTFANQSIHFTDMEIARGETKMKAEGYVDMDTDQLSLTIGLQQLPLNEIPALREHELPISGYANALGTVIGTLEAPVFEGDFTLSGLRYEEWDLGRGKGTIKFEDGIIDGSVDIHSDLGDFSLLSSVSVSERYPGTVVLDFNNLNIRKIVSDKTPPYLKDITTAMKGRIEGEGDFGDWTTLKFHGTLDGAQFKIQDHELQNLEQIQFSIANGKLSFDNARIQGTGTDLVLSGIMPLDDSPTLNMDLKGSLNLEVLTGFREKLDASGSAIIDVHASESKQDPRIIGRVSLENARLEYEGFLFPVSSIVGDIVLSRNVVRFENLRGTAASGSIEMSGTYEHEETVMRSINLLITVEKVRLPYPEDFRSVVNADLRLSGDSDQQTLSGEIDVIRSEYVRDFNLLAQFTESGSAQSGLIEDEPALQNLWLNLDIRSNDGLIIDNELARVNGGFQLELRGTPAYPSLTGRAEAKEGTIFFRGNRFEISHAYADFIDRNRINPVLDIRAEADVKTYRLILDATGTLDNFSLNIVSDPPMSTVDILSLLTTGLADPGNPTSQRESQMAGMSAASVLSENLTGAIGKRVQRILGLESFRVDPFLAGAENDPTARITISERISRDLVVTFSRNLSTNEEQVVVIEYDVGKDLAIIGTRDENGRFGVDFRLRKRF